MKTSIIRVLSGVAVASLLMTGCGSDPKPKEPQFFCEQDGVRAPEWTCNPYKDGYIAAVGIAKMNAGNDKSFQRAEAMASGRDALASQIEVKVSNLFKSYKATTGAGENSTFDNSNSQVSKQLASQTIQGSRPANSWKHPKTQELYLFVVAPTDEVKNGMDAAIKTSFKNDQAMYQKFLAEKANGELDKELEKAGK
jgi:hypothetical protein